MRIRVCQQRIHLKGTRYQARPPFRNEPKNTVSIQSLVHRRVFKQIILGEPEESGGGAKAVFLEMHKGSSQLNQPLVKGIVGALTLRQPEFLKHIVGLEEKLPVETLEIPKIMRIQLPAAEPVNHRGNFGAFMAHLFSMPEADGNLKQNHTAHNANPRFRSVQLQKRKLIFKE